MLDLLHLAAGLLADTAPAAGAIVRILERDFPAALNLRPAQLVRSAGARPGDLSALVQAAGFADLDAVREQALGEHAAGAQPGRERRTSAGLAPVRRRPDVATRRVDVDSTARRESAALAGTLTAARTTGTLEFAAGEILTSRRRWVFGDLDSRGFAQLFAADLSAALGQVALIEPTAAGVLAAIGDVQRRDSLTVFSFRPYSRLAGRLVEHFTDQGATVVAVTDAMEAGAATHVLRVVTGDGERSATATVALATTLAALVTSGAKGAHRRGEKGRAVAAQLAWYEDET